MFALFSVCPVGVQHVVGMSSVSDAAESLSSSSSTMARLASAARLVHLFVADPGVEAVAGFDVAGLSEAFGELSASGALDADAWASLLRLLPSEAAACVYDYVPLPVLQSFRTQNPAHRFAVGRLQALPSEASSLANGWGGTLFELDTTVRCLLAA